MCEIECNEADNVFGPFTTSTRIDFSETYQSPGAFVTEVSMWSNGNAVVGMRILFSDNTQRTVGDAIGSRTTATASSEFPFDQITYSENVFD